MRPGRLAGRALSLAVNGYQFFVRPVLPPACRFAPSCSEYFRMLLETHGPLAATWLTVRRICRCHPWNPGGYDPPPLPVTTPNKRLGG